MLVMFIIVVKLRTFALVRGLRLKTVKNTFKENDQNKKKIVVFIRQWKGSLAGRGFKKN